MILNKKQLLELTHGFYSLNQAGITISNSLDILIHETNNKKLKIITEKIKAEIENGSSLSNAITKLGCFPSMYKQIIEVGEKTGKLDSCFLYLIKYLDKSNSIRKEVIIKLIYPLVVVVSVIIFSLSFVVYLKPVYDNLVSSLGGKMPMTTRLFISFCNFLSSYYLIMLYIFFGLILTYNILKSRVKQFKLLLHRLQFKLPLLRNVFYLINEINIFLELHILISSGINITQSLYICSENTSNLVVKDILIKINEDIIKGKSLETSLQKYKLPYKVVYLLSIGEMSGTIEESLKNIEESASIELENLLRVIQRTVEPLTTIVLAVVVGIIMIAILQPTYSIINSIK